MTRNEQIRSNLGLLRYKLAMACEKAGRDPSAVKMIAVSKFMPSSDIAAAVAAGQMDFGENYAQELARKASAPELALSGTRWHFLGGLQSKKIKSIIPLVSSIHSIDRESVIVELEKHTSADNPTSVFLEINTGAELQKSGATPAQAESLCRMLLAIPGVRLEGLMCIPPVNADPEASRQHFLTLRRLRDDLLSKLAPANEQLLGLSMGMTADYPVAVQEGATVIRIGTAIFGGRQ